MEAKIKRRRVDECELRISQKRLIDHLRTLGYNMPEIPDSLEAKEEKASYTEFYVTDGELVFSWTEVKEDEL